jgi:DNA-binding beta-propeller fold protein YncE
VSLFTRGEGGFELRQTIPTSSQPVSVAFGKTHLYVLGTTTVESHRIGPDGVEASADGTAGLLIADGSAAQVAVAGDELILTEKSGAIERVQLREGAVFGTPVAVALSEEQSNTPFGLTTRGSNAYVTFAGSDTVGVVKNDRQTAFAATGIPGGSGQHAPCWIAVVGPYLFTTNSPSHSVSRLIAGGANILLDDPVAAQTTGAPIDVAAEGDLLALVETGGGASLLAQFHIDEDGNLTRTVSTPIASVANGIAIVTQK